MKRAAQNTNGFSRIELVIVICILAVFSILLLASIAGEHHKRSVCQSNLHQIARSLQLYAQDNRGLLPDCSTNNRHFSGRGWPWDINTNLVADFEIRGAGKPYLYCPSNPGMTNSGHWNIFRNDKNRRVRVLGYCFLLNGIRAIPSDFQCINLLGSGGRSPGQSELVTDAVACTMMGGSRNNDPVSRAARENYILIDGLWKDRTSHLSGWVNGVRPAGGNIAFEDGHVDWRDYNKMQHRIITGNIDWDF